MASVQAGKQFETSQLGNYLDSIKLYRPGNQVMILAGSVGDARICDQAGHRRLFMWTNFRSELDQ